MQNVQHLYARAVLSSATVIFKICTPTLSKTPINPHIAFPPTPDSCRQVFSALELATLDNSAASLGGHAGPEAALPLPLQHVGLVGPLVALENATIFKGFLDLHVDLRCLHGDANLVDLDGGRVKILLEGDA